MGAARVFFTIDPAKLVGESGRVIAVDLQEGMLNRLRIKIQGTELQDRIFLFKCEADAIGFSKQVDFVLAFYMLHEVPNQDIFFEQIGVTLKTKGQVLIVEPPFHVSKAAFEKTLKRAQNAGFGLKGRPKVLFSKTALLEKG